MKHEAHQLLIKVDLFLSRGPSHMEPFWLLSFHLVKAVPQDWFLNQWVMRIEIYRVNFEMVVKGFHKYIEVMSIRQEGVRNY